MGRGRAPCCDKSQVKRGPWSPAEDLRLITFIQKNGHDNWRALPKQAGLARCGKSCRLRWINYLRPDLRRGNFTPEEEDAIIKLHNVLGNKWSKIASHLPGRTDNEIKNVWNTHLKKRLSKKVIGDQSSGDEPKESSITSSASSSIESCKDHKSATVNQELNMVVPMLSNHQSSPSNEETMKVMQSSSSSTSHSSLVSITDELDVTTREELMDSSFDHDLSNNNSNQAPNMEDASHETTVYNGFELVPLEFDYDIWALLDDSLGSFQSSNLGQQVPVGEVNQSCGNNNLVQDEEVDSLNWIKYIECELELDAGSADDDGKRLDGLTRNETRNDLAALALKQDVDQSSSAGLNSFQPWPSSPQTTFFI